LTIFALPYSEIVNNILSFIRSDYSKSEITDGTAFLYGTLQTLRPPYPKFPHVIIAVAELFITQESH